MKLTITMKYFASIREAIGISTESIVCEVNTVGALRDALIAKGLPYAEALARGRSIRTALNQVMCDEGVNLSDGCEVAFFPPVTGG
jgi:molybdopterin synthase sulfur carrier subunit